MNDSGDNSEVEHYVERSYSFLFGHLPPSYRTTDVVVVSAYIRGTQHFSQKVTQLLPHFFSDDVHDKETTQQMSVMNNRNRTKWCPHIMYTDVPELLVQCRKMGWEGVDVSGDTTTCDNGKKTHMHTMQFKLRPHSLKEVYSYGSPHIVWIDAAYSEPHRENILTNIDSFTAFKKSVFMPRSYRGGGICGSVYDEVCESLKHCDDVQNVNVYNAFLQFCHASGLRERDVEGVYLNSANYICLAGVTSENRTIFDNWYRLSAPNDVQNVNVTLYFVFQKYRNLFCTSLPNVHFDPVI